MYSRREGDPCYAREREAVREENRVRDGAPPAAFGGWATPRWPITTRVCLETNRRLSGVFYYIR